MDLCRQIIDARMRKHKLLALLLDPDKPEAMRPLLYLNGQVDWILVGGSTGVVSETFIADIRRQTTLPLVLFPGSPEQFTPLADALLFLTPMNARYAKWLIDFQVAAAPLIAASDIVPVPTAYILIDGGRISTTQQLMNVKPLSRTNLARIQAYAKAAEYMGKQLIYLEAGSGARIPVPQEVISAVRGVTDLPLIVGGGIRTPQEMQRAFCAGADVVVIGNHFEQYPEQLPLFIHD